jgi:hypothetical protein
MEMAMASTMVKVTRKKSEKAKAIRFVVEIPVSRVERDDDGNIMEPDEALQDAMDRGLYEIQESLEGVEGVDVGPRSDVYGYYEYIDGYGNPAT